MSAGTYNIQIDQGADFEVTLTVEGQRLSGFSARGQIRPALTSNIVLGDFEFSITGASTTGGDITMTLPNYVSLDIPAGNHVYDVEVFNDTTRKVTKLLKGNCTIIQGVTR